MLRNFILIFFPFLFFTTSYSQVLDDFNKNHLKEYELKGKPKRVSQRLFTRIDKSSSLNKSNLKLRGPLYPLGSDVFDLKFDDNGRLISDIYYKSFNDTIAIHSISKYHYNNDNRLTKTVLEYFNNAPFSNDDNYYEPIENSVQTTIYSYEKFDFIEDSIRKKKHLHLGRRYREISYKTFNLKQLILDSTIVKYRQKGNYGQDIEINNFTTFFNYDKYPDPTYRVFTIYDRNKRLKYLEHHNSAIETAPNVSRLYKYQNWETLNFHKTVEILRGNNVEIKIYEYDLKNNIIKISKSDLDGNLVVIKEFSYKYDDYDNWIEKIEHNKRFNNINVYTRFIEYY